MTKEEIIEYVMHSPANTNPAVLNSLLEQMGGSGPEFPTDVFLVMLDDNYEPLMSANEVVEKIMSSDAIPIAIHNATIGTKTFYEYTGCESSYLIDKVMFRFIEADEESTDLTVHYIILDGTAPDFVWIVDSATYSRGR